MGAHCVSLDRVRICDGRWAPHDQFTRLAPRGSRECQAPAPGPATNLSQWPLGYHLQRWLGPARVRTAAFEPARPLPREREIYSGESSHVTTCDVRASVDLCCHCLCTCPVPQAVHVSHAASWALANPTCQTSNGSRRTSQCRRVPAEGGGAQMLLTRACPSTWTTCAVRERRLA